MSSCYVTFWTKDITSTRIPDGVINLIHNLLAALFANLENDEVKH